MFATVDEVIINNHEINRPGYWDAAWVKEPISLPYWRRTLFEGLLNSPCYHLLHSSAGNHPPSSSSSPATKEGTHYEGEVLKI
jgi:hypothetical protein